MLRLLLLALMLLMIGEPAAADGVDRGPRPDCGGRFQLCGYIDRETKKVIIPQRFETAQPFSDGLAAVRTGGRYGYIDVTGAFFIKPQFEAAGQFRHGFAEVRLAGRSGVIDRAGHFVVEARFNRVVPFTGNVFIVEPAGSDGSPRSSTDVRLEGLDGPLLVGEAGLYDRRRGWLTDKNLKFSKFDDTAQGLVWAGKRNAYGEDVWGLLRADGSWQVTPRYNHVQMLVEGRAIVTSPADRSLPPEKRRESIRWGAVDPAGTLRVPLRFAYLSYSSEGYLYATDPAPYSSSGLPNKVRHGFVRPDGTLLAGRYFDAIDRPTGTQLPRGRIGDVWYSVEPSGRLVRDQLDGKMLLQCPGGPTIVRRGDMVDISLADGRSVGRFEKFDPDARSCVQTLTLRRDTKWFVLTTDGMLLGGKNGYDDLYGQSGPHIVVRLGNDWAIIDRTGRFTLKPQGQKLSPGRSDKFAIGEGNAKSWIDPFGVPVEAPAETNGPPRTLRCQGGLRLFPSGDLWGLQDETGRTVVGPRYRALSCFGGGVTWTASPGASEWCPVDQYDRRSQALECRKIFYLQEWSDSYPERFVDDPFENSVLWNRAMLDYLAGSRKEPPRWISDFSGRALSVRTVMSADDPIGALGGGRATKILIGVAAALGALATIAWRRRRTVGG